MDFLNCTIIKIYFNYVLPTMYENVFETFWIVVILSIIQCAVYTCIAYIGVQGLVLTNILCNVYPF